MPTKILLADDHKVFRKGLRIIIEEEVDMQVVGEADNSQDAINQAVKCAPDVVLLDISMPDLDGIEAVRNIVADFPHIKVVAMSVNVERILIQEMLKAGAAGHLLKDSVPEEIIDSIRAVMRGEVYLSASITGMVVSEYVKVLSNGVAAGQEPAQTEDDITLLQTKLHPTPLSRNLVPRTHLVDKFDDLRRRPFTLVSAAAGYGKSTLARLWLNAWNGPYGWVSLDEDENDLRIFMTYLLAAIQSSIGAGRSMACDNTQSLLKAPVLPPPEILSRHLLNDLEKIEDAFILVLDDYHKISAPKVHKLMSGLMDHPTRNMHLIMLTRRDPPLPVGKLRGRGQINEIGIFQLRFTLDETTLFLKQNLGLSLDKTTVVEIYKRLEGWVAGMLLMYHSIGNRKDVKHLLTGLQGGFSSIVEYLMAEVLSQQPAEIAERMVETAILNRFCASLCDAIHGRDIGTDTCGPINGKPSPNKLDCQTFITHLKTNNLFLTPLDAKGRWFRYHHLFQELLLGQLKKYHSVEDISGCHLRASAWFAENGFIDEALRHALVAGDRPRAIHLIERHRQAMLNSDQGPGLEKWLAMLTETEIIQRPSLLMTRVWIFYYQGKYKAIPPILAAAEGLLNNKPKEQSLYGEIYLFKAVFSFWQGKISRSFDIIEDALERIPETQPMVRGFAEIYFGLAGHTNGQTGTVVLLLSDLLDHLSMESPRQLRVLVSLVWIHLLSADLVAASIRNRQLADVATKNNSATFQSWVSYNQGIIHYYRNELDSAIHYLNEAAETGYLILRRANVDCLAGLALAYQAMHRTDKAEQTLVRLFELIESLNDPTLLEIAYACKVHLSLIRGDAVLAHRLPQPGQAPNEQPMVFFLEVPAITNCRALLADGTDTSLIEAEQRLTLYLQLNRTHHNTFRIIELMALQSMVVCRQGRLDEALTLLGQAVRIGESGGCVQPFVELGPPMADLFQRLRKQNVSSDYTEQILNAFNDNLQGVKQEPVARPVASADRPPLPFTPSQPLVEPLTNRELDVLELLAQRLQNKEIAEKLFVSNQTVKTHLKNIYQKLGVGTRRQAVTQAYRLGIITRR